MNLKLQALLRTTRNADDRNGHMAEGVAEGLEVGTLGRENSGAGDGFTCIARAPGGRASD